MNNSETPLWFNGKDIVEAMFCEEFLESHKLAFSGGAFFTVDGRVTDEIKKLKPIEHHKDGSPYCMTSKQRRWANALIRKTCCNYDVGNCILLDDGEACACPQTISYTVLCRYFRHVILKKQPALETEIFRKADGRSYAFCGQSFIPGSNRAKYCADCAREIHRRQENKSDRNRRAARTNRG